VSFLKGEDKALLDTTVPKSVHIFVRTVFAQISKNQEAFVAFLQQPATEEKE